MASGKTLIVGKLKINFSKRGIAAKLTDGDKIWRLPFPWAQPKAGRQTLSGGSQSDGRYYDDEAGDYDDPQQYGPTGVLYENVWLMWLLLIVLPPLGIWLLWRQNRYEITIRSAISAAAIIWFVVLLVWLFSGLGGSRDNVNNAIVTRAPSASPVSTPVNPGLSPSPTPAATPLDGAAATPSATPLVGEGTDQAELNPSPSPTALYVWCTSSGKYYHSISTCSGMTGASRVLVSVAQSRSQTACPVCMGGTGAQTGTTSTSSSDTTTYFATSSGEYYHKTATCSGMQNASVITAAAAQARGQKPCPICVGNVYANRDGKYYHSVPNCSGMKDASLVTVSAAKANGQTACPVCMKSSSGSSSSSNSAGNSSNNSTTYYYATASGKYYHKKATCSGMTGAAKVTAAAAQNRGQTPCPVCIGTANTTTYYYATSGGKYYHVSASCSGMTNAARVTLAAAKAKGQTACPVCMKGSAASSTSGAATYYSTVSGRYYHKTATCSGMQGADKVTIATINQRGQTACPKCLGSMASYYATASGKYYHKYATCSGMSGATKIAISAATARGQSACPVCLGGATVRPNATPRPTSKVTAKPTIKPTAKPTPTPKPSGKYYYGTPSGKYYHRYGTCSGMQGAVKITLAQAKAKGQTACPKCLGGATAKPTAKPTPTPKPGTTPKPTAKPDNDNIGVWVTIEGNKYHSQQYCSGMKNAAKTSLTWALSHNYSRCTVCDAPTPAP